MKNKICFVFTMLLLAEICLAQTPQQRAENILEETGVEGGVVAHLGVSNGKLSAALHAAPRYLVHGLNTDAGSVKKARKYTDSLGLYGKVSAEKFDGQNLPYGDNIVDLIVVTNADCRVPDKEIKRVLAPGGAAWINGEVRIKPGPATIDEWTHFLHDASGNAVSSDKKARFPRHIQWGAGPRFDRHHDALASMSAMTSSNGRVFYIYDEGPISVMHRPSDWKLIARNAFNGKLLWKRDIPDWMTHLYNFRAGPKQLPRRLVSVDDRVYATLGWDAPVVKLDAATGNILHTYKGSEGAEELVIHRGKLLVLTGSPEKHIEYSNRVTGYWDWTEKDVSIGEKSVVAYDLAGGQELWRLESDDVEYVMPLSLCALGENVFYLDSEQLHCLDAGTGEQRWTAPFEAPADGAYMRAYAPTVVAHRDVIMCLTWKSFAGYAIEDGEILWKRNKGAMGFASPGDLFAIGDKAWTFPMLKGGGLPPKQSFINNGKTGVAIDIYSGEIVDKIPFKRPQHHHRCYRNKATKNYFLLGHSGIQTVNRQKKKATVHRWVRGLCQYGIMPANGYIYVPPDPCRCYFGGKINGFFALSDKNSWSEVDITSELEKGPAYESEISSSESQSSNSAWPTYRGDSERSGSNECELPQQPNEKWSAEIGEALTAPVAAAGNVYVADKNAYTMYCLDADSGNEKWKYFAGGGVDSPPTIRNGRCVFGSRDGSVYCLNAETGELAWRFNTSKTERRIGWKNRLASPLMVHGSVLIINETVYFAAGYSSNLDRGIRLYGLDLVTGEQRHFNAVASGHWGDDRKWGILSDILSSKNGKRISMRRASFNNKLVKDGGASLGNATGLLDDSWFHRKQWKHDGKAGKLLVFDKDRTVTVRNDYTGLKQRRSKQKQKYNQVGHKHQKFTRYLKEEWFPVGTIVEMIRKNGQWNKREKMQPRAMILTKDKVCVAGWKDAVTIELKTGRAKNPDNPHAHDAVLRIYSARNGERIFNTKLSSDPVFDGLAAADGRLIVSLKNGKLVCYGK